MTAHVYNEAAPKDTATSLVRVSRGIRTLLSARLPTQWTVAPMALSGSKAELQTYLQRAPAVFVSWMRSRASASGARTLRTTSEYVVSIVVRGAKVDQRLAGDSLQHGLLQLAEMVATVLHGAMLTDLGSLQVTSVEPVAVESAEGVAIAAITVAIHHQIDAGQLLTTETPDLTALAMTFVVGPDDAMTQTWTHDPQEAA
jgi:hypothetical protein